MPFVSQQIFIDLYYICFLFYIDLVPDDHSTILRYIIETLFIIHGQTKLNMICPFGGDPERRYGRAYDRVWCDNLNRRSISRTTSTQ